MTTAETQITHRWYIVHAAAGSENAVMRAIRDKAALLRSEILRGKLDSFQP